MVVLVAVAVVFAHGDIVGDPSLVPSMLLWLS